MQRLPIFMHFLILLLSFIGPVLAPRLIALILLVQQTILSATQVRSTYGVFRCWLGTRAHAQTDWSLYWSDQKAKLEREEGAHHVFSYEAVQHVILVPAYKEEMSTLKEVSRKLRLHRLKELKADYMLFLADPRRTGLASSRREHLPRLPGHGRARIRRREKSRDARAILSRPASLSGYLLLDAPRYHRR